MGVPMDERAYRILSVPRRMTPNPERASRTEDTDGLETLRYVERCLRILEENAAMYPETIVRVVRHALEWMDTAKCGTDEQRRIWTERGYNLTVHNYGSAEIFLDYWEGDEDIGHLLYALIRTHGVIGQYIRGEVPFSENLPLLELVLNHYVDPAALSDMLMLLNRCVVGGVSMALYEHIRPEIEDCISDIVLNHFVDRADAPAARYRRLMNAKEEPSDRSCQDVYRLLRHRQMWYFHAAMHFFRDEQVNFMAAEILRELEEKNALYVQNISFRSFADAMYYEDRNQRHYNTYKQRMVESFVKTGDDTHLCMTVTVRGDMAEVGLWFTPACEKLIDFCVEAERSGLLPYEKCISMLYDVFDFREEGYEPENFPAETGYEEYPGEEPAEPAVRSGVEFAEDSVEDSVEESAEAEIEDFVEDGSAEAEDFVEEESAEIEDFEEETPLEPEEEPLGEYAEPQNEYDPVEETAEPEPADYPTEETIEPDTGYDSKEESAEPEFVDDGEEESAEPEFVDDTAEDPEEEPVRDEEEPRDSGSTVPEEEEDVEEIPLCYEESPKTELFSYVKGISDQIIVDVAPGSGAMLDAIESRFMTTEDEWLIRDIVGTDVSGAVLKGLERKKEREGHAWNVKHHDFYEGTLNIKGMRPDTIILSSVLHEIFSFNEKEGRRFSIGTVKKTLKNAFESLARGGRLIIRDCVRISEKDGYGPVDLQFTSEEGMDLFRRFLQEYEGLSGEERPGEESITGNGVRKADINFLREFLFAYARGEEYFDREVKKQYGFWTIDEAVEFAERELEAKVIQAKTYPDEEYRNRLEPLVRLYDCKDGEELPIPDSHFILVVEKKSSFK